MMQLKQENDGDRKLSSGYPAAAQEGRERERHCLIVSVGDDEKALGRDSGDGLYNSMCA